MVPAPHSEKMLGPVEKDHFGELGFGSANPEIN
jgi:hypothetical protein